LKSESNNDSDCHQRISFPTVSAIVSFECWKPLLSIAIVILESPNELANLHAKQTNVHISACCRQESTPGRQHEPPEFALMGSENPQFVQRKIGLIALRLPLRHVSERVLYKQYIVVTDYRADRVVLPSVVGRHSRYARDTFDGISND
jgi:hypothetical protein